MAKTNFHTCTCPRCTGVGRSVAAMNYAETQRWDKRGTFGGIGAGVGAGGIGVGVGVGSYSEHGEQQTKRADVFEEPARFAKPVVSLVVFGVFLMVAWSMVPGLLSSIVVTGSSVQSDHASDFSNTLMELITVLAPIAAVLGFVTLVMTGVQNKRREDRLNKEVWPKQVHRYNALRYCERCHLLFDPQGRSAGGSEQGFAKMMAYLD